MTIIIRSYDIVLAGTEIEILYGIIVVHFFPLGIFIKIHISTELCISSTKFESSESNCN